MNIQHQAGPYRIYVLLFLLLLITAEIIWSWKKERGTYEVKETISNLAVFAGFQFSKYLFAGYQLAVLGFFTTISPLKLPHNALTFLLTFITADFIYYWFHRVSHGWQPLWAFHLIHHSAMHMNLTAAYRLNWFSAIVSPLFFIPAAMLGLPADFIVISYAVNLAYQFFLHTEVVGKLGAVEKVMDTPSSHRVHHGSNPIYIDKNFGGVFIIWDRLFGTYQPETEPVNYGLTTGFLSNNPFKLVLQGFIDWFKPTANSTSLKHAPGAFLAASPEIPERKLSFNVRLYEPSIKTLKNPNNMKNLSKIKNSLLILTFATSLCLLTSSCKKSSVTPVPTTATEADAVEMTTDAVIPTEGGFAVQVNSSANAYKTGIFGCGVTVDSTKAKASAAGVTPSYSYSLLFAYTYSCVNSQLTIGLTGTSSYAGPNMTSNDKSTGTFVLSGLAAAATSCTMTANYVRNGKQTSAIGGSHSYTSILTIATTNLNVDKTTYNILSGTGTVAITGTSSNGNSFSFNGTITFLGQNKATLVLNSGTSYNIQW